MNTNKPNLIGLSRDELTAELAVHGEKPFRAKQVWHWMYFRGVADFGEMTSLSTGLREKLAEAYVIERPKTVTEQLSEDGTRKWLLRTRDGNEVESV